MTLPKRQLFLATALLLTLLATYLASKEQPQESIELAKPVSDKKAMPSVMTTRPLPDILALRSQLREAASVDLFLADRPAPPPAPPPVAPPAPTAPAVPFLHLGTLQEGNNSIAFLAKGQKLYTVREGETFDGQYRLEHIGKTRLELLYLPLNTKQFIVSKGN